MLALLPTQGRGPAKAAATSLRTQSKSQASYHVKEPRSIAGTHMPYPYSTPYLFNCTILRFSLAIKFNFLYIHYYLAFFFLILNKIT